jgi:hypothetical protein
MRPQGTLVLTRGGPFVRSQLSRQIHGLEIIDRENRFFQACLKNAVSEGQPQGYQVRVDMMLTYQTPHNLTQACWPIRSYRRLIMRLRLFPCFWQLDCTNKVVEHDCSNLGAICDLPNKWLQRYEPLLHNSSPNYMFSVLYPEHIFTRRIGHVLEQVIQFLKSLVRDVNCVRCVL